MSTERDSAQPWWRICEASALGEGGEGIRFRVLSQMEYLPAFVLRVEGQPRSFLNRCAHVPIELDWNPGRFLDDSGLAIVCATHGALYDAGSGQCLGGPCQGKGLVPLPCRESDGGVYIQAEGVEADP